ncbi:ferredoxin [Paracoccus sp. (in: a-proteobacteria)]|uniref:ferredoxin n=1 Tax=Paracoccus sp. TaxID=267 RepID=UPI00321FAFFE
MLARIESRLARDRLALLGGFRPAADEPDLPAGCSTLLLLGPDEPGFWEHLRRQPEWDGAPDPLDRWSRRVIAGIAGEFAAEALFPFGGPPFRPFFRWALRSGRLWQSPVRLLVHDRQGLMVSFRGALALTEPIDLPAGRNPCTGCAAPCLRACPAAALGGQGYEVATCHDWLDRAQGAPCLDAGCLVRRACPVSRAYGRRAEQSAYHMRQFHRPSAG